MAHGNNICKVLFGIFFGVLATICVAAAFYIDEITKENTIVGSLICGREAQYLCSGAIDTCNDALIYGYNIDKLGVDETNGVIIVKSMDLKQLCDSTGLNGACEQITAGKLFYYANIGSIVFGVLGILLLIIPCTRQATCGFFIFGGISAATAFAGYLIMSKDHICWDVNNTDVEMAASCWLDIAALAIFIVASIVTMGAKKKYERV
eukprot:163794_1